MPQATLISLAIAAAMAGMTGVAAYVAWIAGSGLVAMMTAGQGDLLSGMWLAGVLLVSGATTVLGLAGLLVMRRTHARRW